MISVVIPTLNEEESIASCIEIIKKTFAEHNLEGEIIVSDVSSDNTPKIAEKHGAKVIRPVQVGYGHECIVGIEQAKGEHILLGDGDGTYDFSEMPKFIELLEKGADIVIGNRFGGKMERGSMPPLHRYIGNPLLSAIFRTIYKVKLSDIQCGMRAFKRGAYKKMHLETTGFELVTEMLIEAVKNEMKIEEVPINYHRRSGGKSKLKSLRDGWRNVKVMFGRRKNAPLKTQRR